MKINIVNIEFDAESTAKLESRKETKRWSKFSNQFVPVVNKIEGENVTLLGSAQKTFPREKKVLLRDSWSLSMEEGLVYNHLRTEVNDIDKFSFNTSVSAFMICINELSSIGCNSRNILSNLCILLSPFAPHICEEIWSLLGNDKSISYEKYTEFDEKFLEESVIEYPVFSVSSSNCLLVEKAVSYTHLTLPTILLE